MARNGKARLGFDPDYAVLPGKTLVETIQELGITQKELSARTGFVEKHISQIITGKAPISPQAALRFEQVTGVPARIWNQLEANYQERLAKLEAAERDAKTLEWLDAVPYKELVKRKAIPECASKVEYLQATLAFFRVATVEAWREGWACHRIAFRKSSCVAGVDGAIAAWVRLAEIAAEKHECQPYSAAAFRAALKDIRKLTRKGPDVFVPAMRDLCTGAGVALALVPELPKAPVSGAARWLTKTKAMIALNLRGKANDRFWFTFFHEAGHILHDDHKEVFVDVAYSDDPCERHANTFAGEFLIPRAYSKRVQQLRTKAEVEAFASEIGIHPGIVVGRLQHDDLIPYAHLNALKTKLIWA